MIRMEAVSLTYCGVKSTMKPSGGSGSALGSASSAAPGGHVRRHAQRLSSLKPPAGEATPSDQQHTCTYTLTFTLLPVGGVKGRYLLTGRFKPRLQSGMLHTCADGTES